MNGMLVFFSTAVLIFVYLFLHFQHQTINNVFASNGLTWFIDMSQVSVFFAASITLLLLPTFFCWAIRNKLYQGVKPAKNRWLLVLRLRKEMIKAKYANQAEYEVKIAEIPTIKVEYGEGMQTGRVFIRNSIKFDKTLESIRVDSALKGYVVEQQYIDDTHDWYIYEFYSTKLQHQSKFKSLDAYLKWSFDGTDTYQIKVDDRFTFDMHHLLLVGQTGSGKTYGLIGLLLQMVNKPINYFLFFADPKNADLKNIGEWINKERTASENQDIIRLIDKVYQDLIDREKKMNQKLKSKMTADYRDFKMQPLVLIFDEFSSFSAWLSTQKKSIRDEVIMQLIAIVQKGRQSGVFLWLIMQKSDASTVPTAIRNNLVLKIVLGNAERTTYQTAFESSIDVPIKKYGKGQGVYLHPTISKPMMISFPFLMFLDEYNGKENNPADLWNKHEL